MTGSYYCAEVFSELHAVSLLCKMLWWYCWHCHSSVAQRHGRSGQCGSVQHQWRMQWVLSAGDPRQLVCFYLFPCLALAYMLGMHVTEGGKPCGGHRPNCPQCQSYACIVHFSVLPCSIVWGICFFGDTVSMINIFLSRKQKGKLGISCFVVTDHERFASSAKE